MRKTNQVEALYSVYNLNNSLVVSLKYLSDYLLARLPPFRQKTDLIVGYVSRSMCSPCMLTAKP